MSDPKTLYARIEELERERDEALEGSKRAWACCNQEDLHFVLSHPEAVARELTNTRKQRDEARARVAAAYEDAADAASEWLKEYPWHRGLLEDIQELATAPERDALAERDARIRAEEREACAKAAESVALPMDGKREKAQALYMRDVIAAAIRARSED